MIDILGLKDCNPAPPPSTPGHDMSKTKEEETPLEVDAHSRYRSALDIARFISDPVGHEISYITSTLAAHQDRPTHRHMLAVKRLGRFIKGNTDVDVE